MMGPNEKEVVRSDLYWYCSKLEDWQEVRDTNGNLIGTEHTVVGGKEHYDEHGDYDGVTLSNGIRYDRDGRRVN